jgi:peptidoglycan-N-acetylglucosamine deacetylase
MSHVKSVCSLSLDLDNQWSYMKTHGDEGWALFPSYLDLVVPRFLEIFDELGWKITVFVVGQDAALEKNFRALKMIADAGHEIGNHSFNHEPWLHLYSRQQIEDEISRTQKAIESVTGQRPRGFRGPGYSISPEVLEALSDHGYAYDASILPTYLGPLARAYYLLKSDLSSTELRERSKLFGRFSDGFRSVAPHVWDTGDATLVEIPVTTMPLFKVPFHFSYLHYIGLVSPRLAETYLRAALTLCRISRIEPSLLLHPLDFLGHDDVPELDFFPAMKCGGTSKAAMTRRFLDVIGTQFTVTPLISFERKVRNNKKTRVRRPAEYFRSSENLRAK